MAEITVDLTNPIDIHAHNTFQQPTEVAPETSEIALKDDTPIFTFPPASVVRLDLAVV